MELDTKQQVLLALYMEYQKDIPKMDSITPDCLGIDELTFNIAMQKLENEGYINNVHFVRVMQETYPIKVIMDNAMLTRDGIGYVETKFDINPTDSKKEKVQRLANAIANVSVPILQALAGAMLKQMTGLP